MTHRVISLIASATEIVAALGYESALVGRSHECDYPASVEQLPICSRPRIDVSGSSLGIDTAVKDAVRDAFSVYEVLQDQLQQLQPTLIVTQTQCDVCAVNLRDVEQAVCELLDSRPQIVACAPMDLDDIWTDIQTIADALGDPAAGQQLVEVLKQRLEALHSRFADVPHRPTIACIEWLEPIMMAGNWIPKLVRIAGGEAVLAEDGQHSPYLTWEDLSTADPEVIALMPCGFDMARTRQELHLLYEHPAWNELQAVKHDRVYLTDGNQFFNRPGPRVVESAEIFAEILHPQPNPQHLGTGWVQLSSCPAQS